MYNVHTIGARLGATLYSPWETERRPTHQCIMLHEVTRNRAQAVYRRAPMVAVCDEAKHDDCTHSLVQRQESEKRRSTPEFSCEI